MGTPVSRQAIRLYDSLCSNCGKEKAEEILSELPLSKTPSEKKKNEWACKSCEILKNEFDSETVSKIRRDCHCKPSDAHIKPLAKLWKSSNSIKEFADKAVNDSFTIEADGDDLILIYPRCYCSFVKHSNEPLPREWCDCTLGYSEEMFGAITGRQVKSELIESVVTGGGKCRIRIIVF